MERNEPETTPKDRAQKEFVGYRHGVGPLIPKAKADFHRSLDWLLACINVLR